MALLLDERLAADGRLTQVTLALVEGRLQLHEDGRPLGTALPVAALPPVMARFARELDPAADRPGGDSLACGDLGRLRRLRFHAVVDAEARDYLVWDVAGQAPHAALATTVTAALVHLATRLR